MHRPFIMLLLVILGLFAEVNGAKILAVWPSPSISHQVVFRPLVQELARRGHEVTVLTTDPAFEKGMSPPNLKEVDLHDISYDMWRAFLKTSTGTKDDLANQIKVAMDLTLEIFVKQVQTDEVKRIIHTEKFDLVLLEACARPSLLFAHIYKVPVILVSSFGGFMDNYERMGAPIHPLVYPLSSRQRIYNLTMIEKVREYYNYFKMDNVYQKQEEDANKALRKLYSDMPSLSELSNRVEMIFLNVHPYWDGNRPVPPSIVYIGGIYQKPKKELPKDLKDFLDKSKYGVIYVSFGTNVSPSTLPPAKIKTLVSVLSQMPYDVLWKWDKDELPGKTDNIKLFKWLPQSDLLRHPKVKLFVTQGGLQSTDEAIAAGVPLLAIPMLADQWYNAEKYVYLGIGEKIDFDNLKEAELNSSVYKILNDESYRKNIAGLRSLMQDQPQSALDRGVWWTEHVLRHNGGRHLRSPSANMTWTEYLELELVLLALALAVVLSGVVIGVVCFLKKQFRVVKIKDS